MNDFLRKLITLVDELNKAKGFHASMVTNDIDLLYSRHVKDLKEIHLSEFKTILSAQNVNSSLSDIRNKLSPIKNLIAMFENGLIKGTIEMHPYVLEEIEQCKKSILYLSENKQASKIKICKNDKDCQFKWDKNNKEEFLCVCNDKCIYKQKQ